MTRRRLIAGNWKLNKTVDEALQLVRDLRNKLGAVRDVDLMIAPPAMCLVPVAQRLEGSNIALGAQELFYEDSGAYTGTISGPMLKSAGCTHVLVGHSERRQLFGETLESSQRRMQAAFRAGLVPVLCIGETLEERDAGKTMEVVGQQLEAGLDGATADMLAGMVIAYEPVWAIGTGKVATPQQAQEVHNNIRERLRSRDAKAAQAMQILYGGSVKPTNAADILGQADIDGALVGGASLDAESFAGIAKA